MGSAALLIVTKLHQVPHAYDRLGSSYDRHMTPATYCITLCRAGDHRNLVSVMMTAITRPIIYLGKNAPQSRHLTKFLQVSKVSSISSLAIDNRRELCKHRSVVEAGLGPSERV
jgi:hypothetical protein